MNEYTRREEVRWIVASAVAVVCCIGGSMASLATAVGPMVPDKDAVAAADDAAHKAAALKACPANAAAFAGEYPNYLTLVKDALTPHAAPEPPAPPPPPPTPGKPPKPVEKKKPPTMVDDSKSAWSFGKPTYANAKEAAACEPAVRAGTTLSPNADKAWKAIAAAAAIPEPDDNDTARVDAAKKLFETLKDVPVDELSTSATAAKAAADQASDAAAEKAKTAKIRQPLPRGLLGREAAVGGGVLISLIALLIHFFSLRATSLRRATGLITLRPTAATAQRGLQAAAIMRLAAEPNGGEPGLVLGCGLGGLVTAIAARQDADWFVVGVMGGLILGLLVQVAIRLSGGSESRFRARALELAEVEKPTVPIVLVLSTIETGREAEFLDAFLKLPKEQQRESVEKMAQQAEEQILVAADAQALGPNAAATP